MYVFLSRVVDWIQTSRGAREILSGAGVQGARECAERDKEAEGGVGDGEQRRQGLGPRRCTISLRSGPLGESW